MFLQCHSTIFISWKFFRCALKKYKLCTCIFRLIYWEMGDVFPFTANGWTCLFFAGDVFCTSFAGFLIYFKSVSPFNLKRVNVIMSLWSYFVVFAGHDLFCYFWYEVWFILLLLSLIGLIACLHSEVFILRPNAVVVLTVSLRLAAK